MLCSLLKNRSQRTLLGIILFCLVGVGQGFAANCAADYVPPENPVWDGSTKTEPCTIGGYYIIDNAAKLAWYANAKNYDKGNAMLTADIDLGGKLWTPIAAGQGNAKYSKTFDGNNHVIKNMYINGTELAQLDKNYAQNLGFIGTLGNVDAKKPGGKVKNLIFENVDIQASTNAGDILGRDDSQISVGVIIGWMAENDSNLVDNCVAASGTIRTTGKGQGVGGIVGNAKNGTISNCLSLVEIHTSGADAYIGGIIGITKTDVTVSSCVYAGPGLVNTGTNGLTGGVVGNVYTGTITTENNYFEGVGSAGVGGSICTKNCNKPPLDSASFNNANTNAQKVDETNADDVACAMNGTNEDGSCKEEPWSLGQTGLSLNGYGADGYKIIFNANEGAFAGNDVTKNIYLAGGMTITDNEVGKPSRDGFSFEGWALTANATEPLENLGTVSGSEKFYAVWTPVYTITFNVAPGVFPESGDSVRTKQVANGDVITVEGLGALPSSRCKVYASENECETWSYFTGWALTEGAHESDSVSLDTVPASDELVLYAVWTDVETYTVTYNANQHGRTTVDYVRVGAGDTVSAPTDPIADDGYEFAGWYTDAAGENAYEFASQIHESIVLYAKWGHQHFNINYVLNEGLANGDNPSSYTIDTAFVLKAPADVDGYVFEGWFNDSSFTTPASQVIKGTTGDKTFYAKWTKKTYRIMYLADNNSQGAITDQFKEHGTPLTLDSAGYFNRKGYTQTGWATDTNGAKVYDFGATYEENAALTLYPSWSSPIEYTITYVCDGCTNNAQNPETYTVLTSTGIKYASSVPEGYRFGGWFSDKQFTKKVTKIESGTIGDLTLYAKLNKIYKITYVGTDKPRCDTLYTVDDAITLRNPADSAGYIFGGWFTNENFEGDAVTGIAKGSTGDTTFYAKWIAEVYPIVYHGIEGATFETPNPETYTVEDGDIDLNSPSKPGYNFLGWSLEENSTEYVDGIAAGSTGEANFYANWEKTYPFLVNDFGAIKVYEDENGKLTAEIDGMSTGDVSTISPEDNVLVNYINFNREFPVNESDKGTMYSTIVLPFTIEKSKVPSADFYELKAVDVPNATVEFWTTKETLQANTPYIIRTYASTLSFNLDGDESVALNTSELNNPKSDDGKWEFRGTYSYIKWSDRADELGRAYGFRAQAENSNAIGSFARIGTSATARPFRAYLLKVANQQARRYTLAKSSVALNTASIGEETIPSSLDVVIVDRETEQTTVIGKLNTATGEIKIIDNWFDMKGRKLNGKPTTKGIYYYNGKRVMVK